jgi:hypothetical protein
MAGGALQDQMSGVGPALRRARERRSLTIEEASRDTKLATEQLRSLEAERFADLLGDVYVRGSLRTYAQYLGISPDKVVAAYARQADDPKPPPPPSKLGRVEAAIAATRIRDNHRLLVFVALTLLLIAVVFGFVSRRSPTPAPAPLSTIAAQPDPTKGIVVGMTALKDVQVTVTLDGSAQTYALRRGEERSFRADTTLIVRLAQGGAVRLIVNGASIGAPGKAGQPWQKTFSYENPSSIPTPSRASPSDSPSRGATSSPSP